jgi:Domain of unknown function (DUF4055)
MDKKHQLEKEIKSFNVSSKVARVKMVKKSTIRSKGDPNPSTPSVEYKTMIPRWSKINALLGGTESMRASGEKYLPRHDEETDYRYRERLNQNFLLNMTSMSLDKLVGYPFSRPIDVPDDMDAKIVPLLTDVDLQSNNLDVFSRNWFREGVAKSFSCVLVEFPVVNPMPDGKPRTLAHDQAEKIRPYLTLIHPENIIYAFFEQVNGVEVLKNVRIKEYIKVKSGFETVETMQIREMDREEFNSSSVVTVRLWRVQETAKGKEEWFVHEEYLYSLPFIPLVTFYSDKQAPMLGKPPLTDMADINIRHWQSQSDQISSLTAARFPMLAFIGVGEDSGKSPRIGPFQGFRIDNPQGSIRYIEHSGAALASGAAELTGLEDKMSSYGVQFLNKPQGGVTATGRILDAEEINSPLMDMVIRFNDALNTVLWMVGQWLKLPSEVELPKVQINTSFGVERISDTDLNILSTARRDRQISLKTYVSELQRRGVLSEEFDPEEDAAELAAEKEETMAQIPFLEPDSAQNVPVDDESNGKSDA